MRGRKSKGNLISAMWCIHVLLSLIMSWNRHTRWFNMWDCCVNFTGKVLGRAISWSSQWEREKEVIWLSGNCHLPILTGHHPVGTQLHGPVGGIIYLLGTIQEFRSYISRSCFIKVQKWRGNLACVGCQSRQGKEAVKGISDKVYKA